VNEKATYRDKTTGETVQASLWLGEGFWRVERTVTVVTPFGPDDFERRFEPVAASPDPDIAAPEAAYRFAVTFLVLLPDGWYEKSLSMRMPPHGLTFNFGWHTIEADSVEYDEETDSCLIMDDPGLYDPDQEGEAEALRHELVAHGFTFREPPDGVRRCRVCGCTDDHACIDTVTCEPCHWVEPDLCSVCADRQGAEDQERERDAQEIRAHEMGSDA
jgi:hypothetical protein